MSTADGSGKGRSTRAGRERREATLDAGQSRGCVKLLGKLYSFFVGLASCSSRRIRSQPGR